VLDGVLDQRLEQQPRDEPVLAILRHVPLERERPAVSRFEDLRVAAQPRDLLVECLEVARLLHRVAKQIAQAHQQATSLARLLGDQTGNGVERVEEEVGLEVRPEPGHLRFAAELLRFEVAYARPLHRERVDDREGPEPEVHLGVEDTEERRTGDDDGVAAGRGHVQAEVGNLERHQPVKDAEDAAERRGDGHPGQEPLARGHLPTQRPPERGRESQHEQRQFEGHEGHAGEDPGRLPCGDHVRRELKQHYPHDDRDADGSTRAEARNRGGGGRYHRARGRTCVQPDGGPRERQSARCFHGHFSVQRGRPMCAAAGRKLGGTGQRKATARHLRGGGWRPRRHLRRRNSRCGPTGCYSRER
jgi:hypothetical protein